MKNETKTLMGIIITILIFLLSITITKVVKIPIGFIPSSFVTNSMELILSGILIYYFQSKVIKILVNLYYLNKSTLVFALFL